MGSELLDFVFDCSAGFKVFELDGRNLFLDFLEYHEHCRHDEHLENHADEHTAD